MRSISRGVPAFGCTLLSLLAAGCGANFEIPLVNGFEVLVMNSRDVLIAPPDNSPGVGVRPTVDELNYRGNYVFGTVVDPDTQVFEDYFLLDTTVGRALYFDNKTEWADALARVGLNRSPVLLRPTAFFHQERFLRSKQAMILLVGAVALGTVILIGGIWALRVRRR